MPQIHSSKLKTLSKVKNHSTIDTIQLKEFKCTEDINAHHQVMCEIFLAVSYMSTEQTC